MCPRRRQTGEYRLVEDGDLIEIDILDCRINILISDEELAARRVDWKPKEKALKGYLRRYAKSVSSGSRGAVLD